MALHPIVLVMSNHLLFISSTKYNVVICYAGELNLYNNYLPLKFHFYWLKIFWPPYTNSWLIQKDPEAGKDWGQEEKEALEDEIIWWRNLLNGCEFE